MALVLVLPASAAAAFDPIVEAKNYSKIYERWNHEVSKPEYQTLLAQQFVKGAAEIAQINLNDPERNPTNLCSTHQEGCAGDVRLYNWGDAGFGIQLPVLWTARNGSTISGHVWATVAGPPQRPGIVITNGSVQAPRSSTSLLRRRWRRRDTWCTTWDPQGQGRSDVFGEEGS